MHINIRPIIDIATLRIYIGIIILFILIYNPPIFGHQLTYIIYLLAFAYYIKKKCNLFLCEYRILILGLLLTILGLSNSLLNGIIENYILGISRLFSGLLTSILIIDLIKYKNKKYNQYTILKYIGYIGIFQSLIVLTAFLSPSFREFLVGLCGGDKIYSSKLTALGAVRGIGWTYAQFAVFSISLGFSMLCIFAVIYSDKSLNPTSRLFMRIGGYFMLIIGLFVARTYVIIIFGWVVLRFYHLYISRGSLIAISNTFSLLIISVISVVYLINLFYANGYISKETLEWAFEVFNNMGENGEIESASTNSLFENHWFLPENLKTFLVGDGRLTGIDNYTTYVHSDVGYVNSIFYWGIIGTFLFYSLLIYTFYIAAKYSASLIIKCICFIMITFLLIYNAKGIDTSYPFAILILHSQLIYNRIRT